MAGYICEFGSAWDDEVYTACPCCQGGEFINEITTVTIPKAELDALRLKAEGDGNRCSCNSAAGYVCKMDSGRVTQSETVTLRADITALVAEVRQLRRAGRLVADKLGETIAELETVKAARKATGYQKKITGMQDNEKADAIRQREGNYPGLPDSCGHLRAAGNPR